MLLAGGYQMLVPEAFVTSLGVTIFLLGVYRNQENPALRQLSHYHQEMVMGFAVRLRARTAAPAAMSDTPPLTWKCWQKSSGTGAISGTF